MGEKYQGFGVWIRNLGTYFPPSSDTLTTMVVEILLCLSHHY